MFVIYTVIRITIFNLHILIIAIIIISNCTTLVKHNNSLLFLVFLININLEKKLKNLKVLKRIKMSI